MGRRHTAGAAGNQAVGGVQVDNTTFTAAENLNIVIAPSGTGLLRIVGDAQLQAQGDLRFADADSSHYVAFQAPATVTSNVTWTLPSTDGASTHALVTNGSGVLSFAAAGSTLTDNTTDSSTNYLTFTTSTSGTLTAARVSSTKLTFQPSTGTLGLLGNTTSSSTTTGTLVVTGGTGISGNLNVGGTLSVTGAATFLGGLRVQELIEDVVDVAVSTNTYTVDFNDGNIFFATTAPVNGNFTFTISNVPTDNGRATVINFVLPQGGTGRIPTTLNVNGSAVTIRWGGGSAPSGTANKTDVFAFTLIRRSSAFTSLVQAALNF